VNDTVGRKHEAQPDVINGIYIKLIEFCATGIGFVKFLNKGELVKGFRQFDIVTPTEQSTVLKVNDLLGLVQLHLIHSAT
jgi:hypothetical protein